MNRLMVHDARWATLILAASLVGCASRAVMCDRPNQCPGGASCVAGRCEAAKLSPSVADAERKIYEPTAVTAVSASGESASVGEARIGGGAILFTKFAVEIPKEAVIVEAYLLLQRAADDTNVPPFSLHARPVLEEWDSGSIRRSHVPPLGLSRTAETRVFDLSPRTIRIDVMDIVTKWQRGARPLGIAVEGTGPTGAGAPFLLVPRRDANGSMFGPRLEVYLR